MYLLFQSHAYLSINPRSGPHSRHGNPPPGCGCSGSAAPPLSQLNHDKAARLEDSYLDSARPETIREVRLNWLTRETSPQAISRSSLQWIGSPAGRALGSGQASRLSQMGRIGGRGDVLVSLVFPLTKDSRAARRFVLADFTALKNTTSLTFSWMFHQVFQLSISCNPSLHSNLVLTDNVGTSMTCKLDRMNLGWFNWKSAAGLPGPAFVCGLGRPISHAEYIKNIHL